MKLYWWQWIAVVLCAVLVAGCGGGGGTTNAAGGKAGNNMPGWTPPGPPGEGYPGAPYEELEQELPPNVVYDSSISTGTVTCTETDPNTGLPIDVQYANDQILVKFVDDITVEQVDSVLSAIGAWKKVNMPCIGWWIAGFQPVATCAELQAKVDQLLANPMVVSVDKSPVVIPTHGPNHRTR